MPQRSRRFIFPWTKAERFLCTLVSFRHHASVHLRAQHPQLPKLFPTIPTAPFTLSRKEH